MHIASVAAPNTAGVFREIAALLLTSVACGAAALPLRQPLVVSYLFAGIVAGPAGLGWVTARGEIELLAHIGVALLLFLVGLKLDLHEIRTVGPVALATGLGQVLFTSVIGYGLCRAMGLMPVAAAYLAVAATFSSTIIIVKLLSDKREIDALHGRIAIGFLIVQDVVAVLAILALSAVGKGAAGAGLAAAAGRLVAVGVAALVGLALISRTLLPAALARLARSQELLVLFGTAWAVSLAALGEAAELGAEVGAFLAGVAIASTPYRDAIASRLTGLRDFMLLFFFLDLGANLDLASLVEQLAPGALLSLFVLIGNPLIVMAIMGWMGYRKRTGFLAGLAVAQVSEFSLILGAMGLAAGHLEPRHLSLLTLVGLVTISLSSYMILFSGPLYARLGPWLGWFERTHPHREPIPDQADWGQAGVDTLVLGLGTYGLGVAEGMVARGRRVLGIDFDPVAVEAARARGLPAILGDALDPELLEHVPLSRSDLMVVTFPHRTPSLAVMKAARARDFRGRVALTARDADAAAALREDGADEVLIPLLDAAARAVNTLLGMPPAEPAAEPAVTEG